MNANQISNTLNEMSRTDLAAVAAKLGVKVGKSKANTVANVTKAIQDGKARFTVQFTIRDNSNPEATFASALFSMKLRTHKPNKVLVAAPVVAK
jgi:hypothetical protein